MADRPWVRVYHADLIRDYPDLWDNDALLATWLRLLVAADVAWPAPAEMPRFISPKAVAVLERIGLVIAVGSHRFSIKGLDADRNARASVGRNAAAKRWQSERNANALPIRAEPSKAEQSSTRANGDAPEWEAVTWLARHGCDIRPGNGYHRHLVTATERHGVNAIVGMFDRLAEAGTEDGDVQGFVFGAIDALNKRTRPELREVAAADREQERRSSLSRRMEATQIRLHDNGAHADERSPSCPRCKEAKVTT